MTIENGTDYTYDNNGNLVSKSTGGATSETFEYDALNRLTKYTAYDGSTTTYKYDPFRRRTEKSSPAGLRKYLWDGIKIVCEYDDADTLTDKLTYGNNREILSRRAIITVGTTTTTANYYYHHDHLGSIVMITDSTGSIVNAYNYDDFGNILSSSETVPNDYAYTGKQIDRESGLYYYGARYYDAKTGRFTEKDLLELDVDEPLTSNRYIYVMNNPIGFIDKWGFDSTKHLPPKEIVPNEDNYIVHGNDGDHGDTCGEDRNYNRDDVVRRQKEKDERARKAAEEESLMRKIRDRIRRFLKSL